MIFTRAINRSPRSGSYTEIDYAPTGAKLQLLNGQNAVTDFVPLPGGATAVYTAQAGGLAYYRHSDWLGSSRLASTPSRTVYYDGAYGPFGEPYAQSGTPDLNFTGMNQDTASNVYDFPMREYGIQGRWPSPDPAGLAAVNPMDPQTWNRYAYVRKSQLELIDPLGFCGGADTHSTDSNGNLVIHGDAPCPPPPEDDQSILDWMMQSVSDPFQPGVPDGTSTGPINGGTVSLTPSRTPQTPTPQKKPCTASDKNAQDLGTLVEAQHYVEAPFLFVLPLATSGAVLGAFGVADATLCTPQPGVLICCPAALFTTVPLATGIVYFDYQYFKNAGSTWKALTKPEPAKSSNSGC